MGLFSDYLEKLRESSDFDPCMVLPSSGYSGFYPSYNKYSANNTHLDTRIRLTSYNSHSNRTASHPDHCVVTQGTDSVVYVDYQTLYQQAYMLHKQCVLREKHLLQIKNSVNLKTYVSKDLLDEYLLTVRENMSYAHDTFCDAREKIPSNIAIQRDIEIPDDNHIAVAIMVDALFYYLTSVADFDDSQFTKNLFSDIALLIGSSTTSQKKENRAKDICRSYFEQKYHPTFGIDKCDNCGAPLYRECRYCFNCFERS